MLLGAGLQEKTTGRTHLRVRACITFKVRESMSQHLSTMVQRLLDGVQLVEISLMTWGSRWRWPDHQVHCDLARHWRAQLCTDQLVQLSFDLRCNVDQLEETASSATFSNKAFADGVKAHELHRLSDMLWHLTESLFEAVERSLLWLINVRLVDLIGEHDQTLLVGELQNFFDLLRQQNAARWIAGVDQNDGSDVTVALLSGFLQGLTDIAHVRGPVLLFIEMVFNSMAAEQRYAGRVKRVLRDRDHDC